MSGDPDVVSGEYTPGERLDVLEDEEVVTVDEDDLVTLTLAFESTRGIYHDSYADVPDDEYHQAVSDVFGIDPEDAADRLDKLGVTREQFIALLALNSHLDGEYPLVERAHMAMMIVDLAPPSPVPDGVTEINDDSYGAFLDDHDRAAVIVWKRFCDPCRNLKEQLDEIVAALPDDVALAGVDGESTPEFCRTFGVEAAPSILLFEGGELLESLRGYQRPETIGSTSSDVYGDG
ncbi:MAG: thioredoxin family protein [Natronomonas sp.]|uniref:Thioredoxin family protein n=1 Tax=Natronomonas salsuginis TaxID=2217661 RepID=A0A4U5JDL0_9EURY|nr:MULTISPECIES: thioredoxin family protein [Natronomonas]MDR9380527.1 thioredoxin family protein [Natronomonas sp.]MDR9430934.1 thioredoxin family protein [Natronomonas sp.]TKR25938.1 thioredoxin family protein [Natronomonas salsuginis]